jgi:hypothetical protein
MGFFDTVKMHVPFRWSCSEAHDLTEAGWQTKDLGCTSGWWSLGAKLEGTPGPDGDPVELPFTGRLTIRTECAQCPALFSEVGTGGNVIVPVVELAVEIERGLVRSAERVSRSSAEQLDWWVEQYGCDGPMTHAEAVEMRASHVVDRARSLRRFLTKVACSAWRAEAGDVEILARLIGEDPGLAHARDAAGQTPLHHLTERIRSHDSADSENAILEALLLLVLKSGGDPNAKDEEGLTPLFFASTPRVATLLVQHGARVNDANNLGSTALMHAIHNPPLFDALLQLGADPHQKNLAGHSAHTWKSLG